MWKIKDTFFVLISEKPIPTFWRFTEERTAEDSNRWVTRTRGSVAKIQKKRKSIEKSYLDAFYDFRNTRNRSSILEILYLVLNNIIQLHLSFEIDWFEVEVLDFHWYSIEIPIVITMGNTLFFYWKCNTSTSNRSISKLRRSCMMFLSTNNSISSMMIRWRVFLEP